MEAFEEKIQKACHSLEIPGAILAASSADGTFRYEKAFGVSSLKSNSPMNLDGTMWISSCTKLITTVAALQCVECGQFGLDEDITSILPELKDRPICTGIEEDTSKPILIQAPALSHSGQQLLTHQSGIAYDAMGEFFIRQAEGRKTGFPESFVNSTLVEVGNVPHRFAPGEQWGYGFGIDCKGGEMVSRVNKLTLEQYFKKYIWIPLGIKDITFHPLRDSSFRGKMVDVSARKAGLTIFSTTDNPDAPVGAADQRAWHPEIETEFGGVRAYSSPVEYQKLLHSICADDGKVLKSASIDEMFRPQLTEAAKATFNGARSFVELNNIFGGIPLNVSLDRGLGGCLNMQSTPGRSEGTMSWGGLPNLHWFIDRKAGLSGIIGTQILPVGDPKVVALNNTWKESLYKAAGVNEKS
ncbi:beta-lactamase/transpeptidase-like protein [Bisporella sp. PMI_857]|nr:beta-lactamase/transpeptidase-like protein [Bisporella sp. PMI_857]